MEPRWSCDSLTFKKVLFCWNPPSRPSVERGVFEVKSDGASKHVKPLTLTHAPSLPPTAAITLAWAWDPCFPPLYTWCCRRCGALGGALEFAKKVHARELGSKPQPEQGQTPPPARRRQDVQGVRCADARLFSRPLFSLRRLAVNKQSWARSFIQEASDCY